MSQQVTINGKKFEPSAALARQFGYSMDYVSRLAREGKVEATRVGRQWFVEALSLKNFVEEISKQKEANREQLRIERRLELVSSNSATNTTNKTSRATASTYGVVIPSSLETASGFRKYFDITLAAVGTTLVLVAGLLSAAVINPSDFLSFFPRLDTELVSNSFSGQKNSDVTAGALGSWLEYSETSQVSVVGKEDTPAVPSEGITVFDEKKSPTELENIRASFSDEVEINFTGEDTGVITPVFLKNKGDDYQFLMVPIPDAS